MRYIFTILLLLITLLNFRGSVFAQNPTLRKDFWVTNGKVYALAQRGDSLFIAGGFTRVFSPITGESFNCRNITVLNVQTGRPFNWFPQVDDTIRALALSAGRLLIGGDFLAVNQQTRFRLAAFNLAGELLNWAPAANHRVYALASWRDTLFVGGKFTQISGSPARYLGVLQISNGQVRPYNQFFPNDSVAALAIHNDRLYVGGGFTKIGEQNRKRLAVLNLRQNQLNSDWNFDINGIPRAFAFRSDNSYVYVGGNFTQFGDLSCSGLVAVNNSTFEPQIWVQSLASVDIYALAFSQDRVIVGGKFEELGNKRVQNLAIIDTAFTNDNTLSWNASPNGIVYAILPTSNKNKFYVGGAFNEIAQDNQRAGIAEFNDCDLIADVRITPACEGNPGVLAAIPFGGTGIYTYSWFPAVGVSNPRGRVTNVNRSVGKHNYTLLLQDSRFCTFVGADTFEVFAKPEISVEALPTFCKNQSGSLKVQVSGASPFEYRWSPETELSNATIAEPIVTPTENRTYTLRVTDSKGCVNTALAPVAVFGRFAFAGGDKQICRGDTIRLEAAPAQSYAWKPEQGIDNPSSATPLAFPLTTTTYTLQAQIGACTDIDSVTITVLPAPDLQVTFGASEFCSGQRQQILGLSEPGIFYSWSPREGLSNPISPITSLQLNRAGRYQYTLSAQNTLGCVTRKVYNFSVLEIPTLAISANRNIICRGDTVFLSAQTNAPSYSWSGEQLLRDNALQVEAKPSQNAVYEFLAHNAACTIRSSIAVRVVESFTVDAGPDTAICLGKSAPLRAGAAARYLWLPGKSLNDSTLQSPIATPTATQVYTLFAENEIGCRAQDAVTVSVNPLPNFRASSTASRVACPSEPVLLSANFPSGVSFRWEPAALVESASTETTRARPAVATVFSVTVTDGKGCQAMDTLTVSVDNPLEAALTPDSQVCMGDSLQLQVTGGQSYIWTPSEGLNATQIPNPIAKPTRTLTYTVSITHAAGACTTDKTVTITALQPPLLELGEAKKLCKGSSLQLTPLQNTGIQFSWLPSVGLSSALVANPIAFPSITTTYTLFARGANGCAAKDSITIDVKELPAVTIDFASGSSDKICQGQSAQWIGQSSIPAATFLWSPSIGVSNINIASPSFSPPATTVYTLTVIDTNGCESSFSRTLFVYPLPLADAGRNQQICRGEQTRLEGRGEGRYLWSPATDLSDPTSATPIARPLETTTYTLTVTDNNNGCQARSSVTVTVLALPTPFVSGDRVICEGGSVQLTASGGVSYEWQPRASLNNPFLANPIASPSATTVYTVTVRGGNGCGAKAQVTVNVNPLPNLPILRDTTLCRGQSVQLTASGAFTYEWSPAAGLSATNIPNPIATPTQTTVYTLTGRTQAGCFLTRFVQITVNPLPTARIAALQTQICRGQKTVLEGTGGLDYSWQPVSGLSSPNMFLTEAEPITTTVYTLTVRNQFGCSARDSIVIAVKQPPSFRLLPTQDTALCDITLARLELAGLAASNIQWFYNGTPIEGANSAIYAPSQAGEYFAHYTFDGCNFTTPTRRIEVYPKPVVEVSAEQTTCFGQTQAQLSASGGVTFNWQPALGLNNSQISNPVANPRTTTVYTVTVTNAEGCQAQASVRVNVIIPPALAIESNGKTGFCQGDSLRLEAANAVPPIFWFNDNTLISGWNDQAIWVKTPGQYSFQVEIQGCPQPIRSESFTVRRFNLPNVRVTTPIQTVCRTFRANLQATGAISYTWEPSTGLSGTMGSSVHANPGVSTTYTVTGRDINGCAAQDQVRLIVFPESVPPLPIVTPATEQRACEGTPIDFRLSNTLEGVRYQWQRNGVDIPGASQNNFSALQSGRYRVKASANNCNAAFSPETNVQFLPGPVVEVITKLASCETCPDGKITITPKGTALPYTYALEGRPFSTNNVIDSLLPGTYVVNVRDANNCVYTFSVTIGDLVGIGELDKNIFWIYPNPFWDNIILQLQAPQIFPPELEIFDVTGKQLTLSENILASLDGKTYVLDLNYLPAGVYWAHIKIKGRKYIQKLIKR